MFLKEFFNQNPCKWLQTNFSHTKANNVQAFSTQADQKLEHGEPMQSISIFENQMV